LTRLTNDLEQVRSFIGPGLIQVATATLMLAGAAMLLVVLNWRLALIVLVTIPAILFLLAHFVAQLGPLFAEVQKALARLNIVLQENLTGIRIIRACAREEHERARYRKANEALLAKNLGAFRSIANHFPLLLLLANIGSLAIVWYGGLEVIGGRLSIGDLVAFHAYMNFLLSPILATGFLAAAASRAGASSLRIFEILDAVPEIKDSPGAVEMPSITGQVEFRDVHFRYPGSEQEALRGLSFTIMPSQVVAIVGRIGSGKSTAINLLPRFYDVDSGAVLIDGYDVRDVRVESLRSQMGIVLQQARLFSGTVRENICYGKPDAPLQDVERAARLSQADSFIRELPHGYDTVIGESGVGLSRGQRQRIALARVLLVSPAC
jgi:ATP-binding cassette, subfamily B, multidrug efflux pump